MTLVATPRAESSDALLDLLETVWPGISVKIRRARALGFDWHRVSRAYLAWSRGRPVAHVGVVRIPMFVGGLFRRVAGIHAVCTHPAHRGKGHFRRLLATALVDAAAWTDTVLLATLNPALFEPAGFRAVSDCSARVSRGPAPSAPVMQRLSADRPADVRLLTTLLKERTPVSHRLAAMDPGWLFVIDEVLETGGFGHLWYAEDLETVVAAESRGTRLHLLDVVARRFPELEELTARLPGNEPEVLLHFAPDRLAPQAVADPTRWDDTVLMVRGPFDPGPGPWTLSPLARC